MIYKASLGNLLAGLGFRALCPEEFYLEVQGIGFRAILTQLETVLKAYN